MTERLTRGAGDPHPETPRRAEERPPSGAEEFHIGAKMRALRRARRLTLREVARETGFSPALISQIENDNVTPPIGTLARIARVLRVKVGHFFEEGDSKGVYEVVRVGERRQVDRVLSPLGARPGYRFEALARSFRNHRLSPFLLTMSKDSKPYEDQYTHEGDEFIMVLSGRIEVEIGEESYQLDPGDSVYLEASLKHRLVRAGDQEATVLAILCR